MTATGANGVRPRTVLMVLGVTLLVALALAIVYLAWQVITWILLALFLALALDPAVESFERRGLRRGFAVAIVFALALLGVTVLGFVFIPPLVREITGFIDSIPDLIADVTRGRGPLGFLERDYQIVERARQAIEERGVGGVLGFTAPALAVVRGVVTAAIASVTIAFLLFFMLLEGPRWVQLFLDLVPERSRPRWQRVAHGIYRTISGYVTGNLLISLIAGVSATVVLLATGVPYAVALGLLVALLDLIPLTGATLAAIIVSAIAFIEGIVPGIVVLLFLVTYQQIENQLIQPLIYGRTVRLSPLAVLIAVLIGAKLGGVLGALAAIPTWGSIQVVLTEIWSYRREQAIEMPPGASRDEAPARSYRLLDDVPEPGRPEGEDAQADRGR